MDYRFLHRIAELYNSDDPESPETKAAIEKMETKAVTRYLTDVANAIGIRQQMEDLPIVIASLRAQADFLSRTLNEDQKQYVDYLEAKTKKMKVCNIEVDLGELLKQIREENGDRGENDHPKTSDEDEQKTESKN